ncbi:DivIVA domain-containing protein [Nocardia nova]|uniref:DivIVA domain-containing protein n=1 Tax=Nocardia nova TaxID=37330 RepID=UPI0026C2E6B6
MLTLLLYVLIVGLVAGLLFLVASAVFGRGEELGPLPEGTTVTVLPAAGIRGSDVRALRFQQVFRGYKAGEVDWALSRLAARIDELEMQLERSRSTSPSTAGEPETPPAQPNTGSVRPPTDAPPAAGNGTTTNFGTGTFYGGAGFTSPAGFAPGVGFGSLPAGPGMPTGTAFPATGYPANGYAPATGTAPTVAGPRTDTPTGSTVGEPGSIGQAHGTVGGVASPTDVTAQAAAPASGSVEQATTPQASAGNDGVAPTDRSTTVRPPDSETTTEPGAAGTTGYIAAPGPDSKTGFAPATQAPATGWAPPPLPGDPPSAAGGLR